MSDETVTGGGLDWQRQLASAANEHISSHHHFHFFEPTPITRLLDSINHLTQEVRRMSEELEALKTAIAAEDQALDKLVAFVKGVPAAVAAAVSAAEAGDADALKTLTADVQAHSDAILAELPAMPAPAPAPPQPPAPAPAPADPGVQATPGTVIGQ